MVVGEREEFHDDYSPDERGAGYLWPGRTTVKLDGTPPRGRKPDLDRTVGTGDLMEDRRQTTVTGLLSAFVVAKEPLDLEGQSSPEQNHAATATTSGGPNSTATRFPEPSALTGSRAPSQLPADHQRLAIAPGPHRPPRQQHRSAHPRPQSPSRPRQPDYYNLWCRRGEHDPDPTVAGPWDLRSLYRLTGSRPAV